MRQDAAETAWTRWWRAWGYTSLPGVCLGFVIPGTATAVAVALTAAAVAGVLAMVGLHGDGVAPAHKSLLAVVRTTARVAAVAV